MTGEAWWGSCIREGVTESLTAIGPRLIRQTRLYARTGERKGEYPSQIEADKAHRILEVTAA